MQAHFAAVGPGGGAPPPAATPPSREAELAAILGPGVPSHQLRALLERNGNNVGRAADVWFRSSPPAEVGGGGGPAGGGGSGGSDVVMVTSSEFYCFH